MSKTRQGGGCTNQGGRVEGRSHTGNKLNQKSVHVCLVTHARPSVLFDGISTGNATTGEIYIVHVVDKVTKKV